MSGWLLRGKSERPSLLDLFCGAGGAAMGYHYAGFDVVGIDIEDQPDYPFEFYREDAADSVTIPALIETGRFAAIHASPPCQAYTAMGSMWNAKNDHPDLVDEVRLQLRATGLPYVIENVPGAPMQNPVTVCGSSLALGVKEYGELRRHRLFECSFPVMVAPCAHQKATIGVYGDHVRDRRRKVGSRGVDFPEADQLALAREAMGMPWVTRWKGLSQAIPPAYTEHIGGYLLRTLREPVAA